MFLLVLGVSKDSGGQELVRFIVPRQLQQQQHQQQQKQPQQQQRKYAHIYIYIHIPT